MVECDVVRNNLGHLTVDFGDCGLYLQTDYEITAFGVNCGLIPAPENWDGSPSSLDVNWWEYDFEEITKCPREYREMAS